MAKITLDRAKLEYNYNFLDNLFEENDIDWGVVTKLLCGNTLFLKEVIRLGAYELDDSRISNLKVIKEIDPEKQTVYIKPPAEVNIQELIKYADVSFNSEIQTIRKLSEEAGRQNKTHKIIIMIELGDLREGVMGHELINFYKSVFELPNIEIIGFGANLNCLNGVMPSEDKLMQLILYKKLVEATFDRKIPWVTGGSSVTIPLLLRKSLPKDINHFRVGETLFFGADLFSGGIIENMHDDVLQLQANIIEINEKPKVPTGMLAENPMGDIRQIDEEDYGKKSYRAILDIGRLDIDPKYLIIDHEKFEIIDASSDMLIIDLGPDSPDYKVGETIAFKLKYMGALSLLSSDYIEKKII